MADVNIIPSLPSPSVYSKALSTTFHGVQHYLSSSEHVIHQFRGIKYASIPARFRRSQLHLSYPSHTDATRYGPICPQSKDRGLERRLFGLRKGQYPRISLRHDEFECLNLIITRPGRVDSRSKLPVMVWIHGGGNVGGAASDWMYDAGRLVLKGMHSEKPVIIVSINYRLGLLGFAASELLRQDNAAAGQKGVGNYGLWDQRNALLWIQANISAFGGDPNNVTLFGSSAGATDIHCHLLSAANTSAERPLFHRAILQSGVVTPTSVQDVSMAGWQISRIMSALHISTVEDLRTVEPQKFVALTGERIKPVDDGYFFRKDWKTLCLSPTSPLAPCQDVIFGDCEYEAVLWEMPAKMWTKDAVVRRVRAIVQSVYKADALLRAYDIGTHTPDDEVSDRVLELINDAHFAYSVDLATRAANCSSPSSSQQVSPQEHHFPTHQNHLKKPHFYRYIFDQASPYTDTPHHAVDLVYLFGNIPFPQLPELTAEENAEMNWDRLRVRDAMQERWIAFANGEKPWTPLSSGVEGGSSADKVFVFGPEGETGERCRSIFECRRRVRVWREAFDPLGLQVIQKVGSELSNGPPINLRSKARF